MNSIFATGLTGSIGQFFSADAKALNTRLEDSVETRVEELGSKTSGPYALVHFAALTLVKACEENPTRAFELNVEGALRWLKAAHLTDCLHFVYVSTGHVFLPKPASIACRPEDPPDATSVYGKTKAAAEKELRKLAKILGIRLTVVRIFSVISPRMRSGFLYPALIERALSHDLSPLPGHQNVRDFITAESIAPILRRVCESPNNPPILHVCSGIPLSVRQLAESVFTASGYALSELEPLFPQTKEVPNYLFSVPMTLV